MCMSAACNLQALKQTRFDFSVVRIANEDEKKLHPKCYICVKCIRQISRSNLVD